MKLFKRLMATALATTMLVTSVAVQTTVVSAAPSLSAGWNESLYAEWVDANPDSDAVKVGYKLSSDSTYTYLTGDDHKYLIRPAATSGYGRVDIPALKEGRYDIEITASDGTVHTRNGIKVYAYDRSGYAHFNSTEGIGAYNNDGTLKDNAIVVYVTDENKDTVEIPGYEGHAPVAYASSTTGATWTRETQGVGNILNNNHKFVYEVVSTDAHPLAFRFIGKVTPPKNLTPYNEKTLELGGSKGDNGNLAITKYGKNITLEGIGSDAEINGWGFTFSQTATCPADSGKSFEVRNLTFRGYAEDGLGFQGDDGIDCPIERVWVHNNVFYPGYCANPAESDKGEGDGSCDFKRGKYYTMSYNHYIDCHKTNLVGSGTSDDQFYTSLHHNWYQNVGSRQPLAANGNHHIYSTYFDNGTSTTVDLRGKNCVLLEENYYSNCKSDHKSRNNTCIAKSYNEIMSNGKLELKGKRTVVASKDEAVLTGSGYNFPDGTSIDNFDLNPNYFYVNNYFVTPAAEVPEYVKTYAGTLKAFPETESGEIIITVTSGGSAVTDAAVTANGLSFRNNNDGTYTATASLGAEYVITVSKDGYSNAVIKSDVLNNDGEIFRAAADLVADYDGYAVVKLLGGAAKTPVKGATVKLADGTVLADQGDGTYKSAAQLPLGDYKVTITNTGDYIAPTGEQTITVKTTDAATEILLDKLQGTVSVTLQTVDGETQPLNTSKAVVTVGETTLTNAGNNTFTGTVDVSTPYNVVVNVPGWNTVSITPATLTANTSGTATAVATLSYKGQLFTWNYTDDTNTDNFFTFGTLANWSSASKNPVVFDGQELTKAVKVNSSFSATFEAATDGVLTVVSDAKAGSSVYLENKTLGTKDSYDLSTQILEIPVKAGTNVLSKNKTESHMYLLQFAGSNEVESDTTTETTTETTTIDTNALSDEVMWDVQNNLTGTSNGLTFTEEFFANEDDLERDFVEGDKTYTMINFVQGRNNPKNAAGFNPQGATQTDRIPVTGSFLKYVPEKNGVFTIAAKTNGGKASYVTDANGTPIVTIGSADINNQLPTSYDIIRVNVTAGETYYVYSGGSNICFYYLGFTSDGTMPPAKLAYGDADNSGKLTSNDAAEVLAKALNNSYVTPLEIANPADALACLDVTKDGNITAEDAANVLTKVLDSTFTFAAEK